MSEFEVRVKLVKEFPLSNLHTAKTTRHSLTREVVLKVLLVKDSNIKVWE